MKRLIVILGVLWGANTFCYAQQHVFVFLNSKPDKEKISDEESEALQKAHMANIELLVTEGKMIVAGPFEGGGGIFILKTGDVKEAKKWLETDPAVAANRWDIELFPITFLKGGACLATEPYEMVIYNLARVRYINDIANYKVNSSDSNYWTNLQEVNDVLAVGTFSNLDGGIIVYNKESENSFIGPKDKDALAIEHKKVWVAKGSFCEGL